jgi:hypothetical protein
MIDSPSSATLLMVNDLLLFVVPVTDITSNCAKLLKLVEVVDILYSEPVTVNVAPSVTVMSALCDFELSNVVDVCAISYIFIRPCAS